ncbi:hypothetical protein AnigIFM63309_006413 [Aspergillus niger]|uniref:DUF2293 domain-containing protein n=1 Tax=Aspergillus welwitschiae TaxID=1341132 RepID=A0A3F3QCG6_9EURO|nr:hypothetical protein BDQ94DRAFT_102735 [Aspergillus welwitschiae]RDH36817.1 hypothetical protein BDQ94DRAFT_102735 [Aspergillus welwitschiae]GLA39083.1 hypothetical protein AnigIFM63309_006413 [Aspergillus niger]
MSPRTPGKASRPGAARRRRGRRKLTPRSPLSLLAQTRKNSVVKKRDRGDVVSSTKTKLTERRSKPGRSSRLNLLPLSTEPREKNCFRRDASPANYRFVPKGDLYITRNCRKLTKESGRIVYVVYDDRGKNTLGLRVPVDIHEAVLRLADETAHSRAQAIQVRDEKDSAQARQLLRAQFPLMPDESLDTILEHAFLKGSGRVGRTSRLSDEDKAKLAVEAHIRHTHTSYEALLKAGKTRGEARQASKEMVQAIRTAWAGGNVEPTDCLTMRDRVIVID